MASSSSTPTIPPPPSSQSQTSPSPAADQHSNNKNPLIHTVALGVTPLALLALFLPPRRLDLRATMLGGVALWGTNQLAQDYSGKSFAQRFSSRMALLAGTELPEKAKATQARLRDEKERRERLRALREEMIQSGRAPAEVESWTEGHKRALLEAYERQRTQGTVEAVAGEKKGVLEKIWMGDAAPDWKEKRDQREKEALQEGGGGYLGLITEQISEVWGGGKKNEGDASEDRPGDDGKKS
ncbi:hypothetical protein F4678DRAFT_151177 [Xylaria arbuscula]|nr:hypothetical protein F4678DRAFT_151177 [Xylaria arbuscula]